jgi:polynucleotide 5'-kinase involved in rRNA processing
MALARYFENSNRVVLDLRRVKLGRCYYRTGEPIDPETLGVRAPIIYAEKLPEGLLVVVENMLDDERMQELRMKFGQVKVIVKGTEQNVLVGLMDRSNIFLGIGIIEEIDYARGRMVVITPVKNGEKIAAVQFGSMKVRPTGEEIGTVKPGTF